MKNTVSELFEIVLVALLAFCLCSGCFVFGAAIDWLTTGSALRVPTVLAASVPFIWGLIKLVLRIADSADYQPRS
jgi:hypothetical protein